MIKTGHAQQKTMWRGNKIKVIDSLVATLNAVKQSLQNSLKKKKLMCNLESYTQKNY